MSFLSFLVPQIVEKVNSPFNGEIQVIQYLGETKIVVNNMLQSGGLVRLIWQKAIRKISNIKYPISNVLILGLGGGSTAQIIHDKFPKAKITGVEIDPEMIKLGKKYFGLSKIKNLTIINNDALKTPRRLRYNLILVDLYLGDQIPPKSESAFFLKNLSKILTKKGIIIFNRLFYGKNRKLTENFIKKLDKIFPQIELVHAWSNLLVVCYK